MATEQHLRQQLAAAYRLAALFGWEDTLYTHFSVRLPGDGEPRFLINPFGMMFHRQQPDRSGYAGQGRSGRRAG